MTTAEAGTSELAHAAGLALDAYRGDHVGERIRRALQREGVSDVRSLASLIARDQEARSRFRRSVAVSVSGLFRDPAQFDLLEGTLLPQLIAGGRRISVWSAGCADGSELYSVAVLLQRLDVLDRARLLGSDLLDENLALARRGSYEGGISFSSELRAHISWERRDLLRAGAAPGKWRLILCRNLAIYLAPEPKRALHERLAGALARGGILLLGRSERISDPERLGLRRTAPHAYVKEVYA
jgi:chemotaxis protein methyltransferase CheR